MRVILDTNIIILREDDNIVRKELAELLQLLNRAKIQYLIHPGNIEDIKRDKNETRKRIVLSKLSTYNLLDTPPDPSHDFAYLSIVGAPKRPNDLIDNALIYCVYKDAKKCSATWPAGGSFLLLLFFWTSKEKEAWGTGLAKPRVLSLKSVKKHNERILYWIPAYNLPG